MIYAAITIISIAFAPKALLADEARELYEKGLDPEEILRIIMRQGSKQSE